MPEPSVYNVTLNWFAPDQTDIEFVQIEVRSVWHGHAQIYPVDSDANTGIIQVDATKQVHWEVRAYYNNATPQVGVLVAAGDVYGGVQEPPPSNLRVVLEMGDTACTTSFELTCYLTGFAPKEHTAPDSPAGAWLLTRQADGSFHGERPTIFNDHPGEATFFVDVTCVDGVYEKSVSHSIYGEIGGGPSTMGTAFDVAEGVEYGAGTINVFI